MPLPLQDKWKRSRPLTFQLHIHHLLLLTLIPVSIDLCTVRRDGAPDFLSSSGAQSLLTVHKSMETGIRVGVGGGGYSPIPLSYFGQNDFPLRVRLQFSVQPFQYDFFILHLACLKTLNYITVHPSREHLAQSRALQAQTPRPSLKLQKDFFKIFFMAKLSI